MDEKQLSQALIIVIASLLKDRNHPFNMRELRLRIRKHDNDECADLINKWVRSKRGREALKRHLIDKATVEVISEEIDLSPKQTTRILKTAGAELYSHV